jgi:hypothetical protein
MTILGKINAVLRKLIFIDIADFYKKIWGYVVPSIYYTLLLMAITHLCAIKFTRFTDGAIAVHPSSIGLTQIKIRNQVSCS